MKSSLLKEIKALGGDATDLDLIQVDSDIEDCEEDAPPELLKELKMYLKNQLHLNPKHSIVEEISDDEQESLESTLKPTEKSTEKSSAKSTEKPALKQAAVEPLKMLVNETELLTRLEQVIDKKLKVIPTTEWFTLYEPVASDSRPTPKMIEKAKYLFEKEVAMYQELKTSGTADKEFIANVLKNGTTSDKISALTLLVQESPVHSFHLLQNQLLPMAKKKARREALLAVDAIKDLCLSILPDNRKLKYLVDQPVTQVNPQVCILWYFEEQLKYFYYSFVQVLAELLKDPLSHIRQKVVFWVYDLLCKKPEQEQNLLEILVNKLGDQEKKVASKVVHLLLQLLEAHPNMKSIVIQNVKAFLYRPNLCEKSRYYAINFLTQIILSKKEDVADDLIELYFGQFETIFVKKEFKDADNKMMATILCGVNRAYPFHTKDVSDKMDMIYKVAHVSTFNTTVQALQLIYSMGPTDRYYRLLYETLLDKNLLDCSKQALYLNLLYKSLKADSDIPRVSAFIKRMVQFCFAANIPMTCSILFLISRLLKEMPALSCLVKMNQESNSYDYMKRDPKYANAQDACCWELTLLTHHFHPTVSLYATQILSGKPIEPQGTNYDPLQNHTLIRFLDRFVYKAPKKLKSVHHGSSIMQPRQMHDNLVSGGKKLNGVYESKMLEDLPVNSSEWAKQETIPVDEQFYFEIFKSKANENDGMEEEDQVWDAMLKSSGLQDELEDEMVEMPEDELESDTNLDMLDDVEDDVEEDFEGEFEEMGDMDDDMDDLIQEEEDLEESDEEEKPAKKRKLNEKLKQKAKNLLGYSGDFFDSNAVFADASDFHLE